MDKFDRVKSRESMRRYYAKNREKWNAYMREYYHKKKKQWIPVTERLPEKDGIYLTFNKKKQYEFHTFQVEKRMWPAIWAADGVTHWMPLPDAPKEDAE